MIASMKKCKMQDKFNQINKNRKMKRNYLITITVTLLLFMSSCLTQRHFIKGQAEWSRIQLSRNFDYESAFNTVLDMLSDQYEMEMISLDGGYMKTAWNYYTRRNGTVSDMYQVRIIVKFNHDGTQMSIKTEAKKNYGDTYIRGVFPELTQEIRDDVANILGV